MIFQFKYRYMKEQKLADSRTPSINSVFETFRSFTENIQNITLQIKYNNNTISTSQFYLDDESKK